MKKRSNVKIMTGGGGRALSAQLGIEGTSMSLRAVVDRVAIQVSEAHPREIEHDLLTPNQLETGLTAGGSPRASALAMTPTGSVLCLVNRLSVKKCALTMAARLSWFHNGPVGLRSAFTMAEILLSLTIIGVVAAITLPSLTGNINERTWNTQRKALYARMSQAIALMPALNGYGTLTEDESGNVTEDNAAETFVTAGLSKVLKINNICDNEHLKDCGIPDKVTALNGSTAFSSFPETLVGFNNTFNDVVSLPGYSSPWGVWSYSQTDTKAAAFETGNGESIVVYYSPTCRSGMNETLVAVDGTRYFNSQTKICANFVYDLNGTKGPNTVGKDIGFITALYPSDSVVVAPMPLGSYAGSAQNAGAVSICKNQDSESRLPNMEELIAIFCNRVLINGDASKTDDDRVWSSSRISEGASGRAWGLHMLSGQVYAYDLTGWLAVRCVKR